MKTQTTTTKRTAKKVKKARAPKRSAPASAERVPSTGKVAAALRRAEEAIWETGLPPHRLLQELHESLLLRCLEEADGNYAAAAAKFGPSRQSVQQYANSPLRDGRWKRFQQNRRKQRDEV